ncbi:MAG: hypothetical protein ABSH07_07815 [Candidatus Dormibacteria bacterium]|jgi:hypothetical protein
MFTHTTGGFHGAPWAIASGRRCRACSSTILARDGFGLNEGICPACRGDAEVELTGRVYGFLGGGGRLAVRAAAVIGETASRSLGALRRAA